MEHTYIDSINNQAGEATMRLYGAIGPKVDGDLFAQELASLDGLDLVKIRINSPGGDVLQGMSIVSAMLAMTTPVHIHIDGVAASMAGVIAACGDKVYMMDFSQYMIHDPAFAGKSDDLTPKQKKMLARIRSMLVGVLSRRGKDEEEVSRLMSEETWFSAQQAQESGLCDEIVPSAHKGMKGMTPLQIIARIDAEYQPKSQERMKLTNEAGALLNLSADAPEADVSAAIVALGKRATAAELRAKTAEDKLTEIENKAAETRKAEAKELIAAAAKAGRINADDKKAVAGWETFFETDHEGAKAALAAIAKYDPISPKLGGKTDADEKLLAMTWEQIDKANRLGELKANHPDAYAEKFEARFGKKPE